MRYYYTDPTYCLHLDIPDYWSPARLVAVDSEDDAIISAEVCTRDIPEGRQQLWRLGLLADVFRRGELELRD